MCPLAHSNGRDRVGLGDEFSPSLAGCVDDVVVGIEDTVREPVLAHELPDVLDGIQLRRARGQEDRRDVSRHLQLVGRVPSGPVEQEHRVGSALHMAADLVEMLLHGPGVGIGEHQGGSGTPCRADGAEQIGRLVTLICGLSGSGSPACPLPHDAVLLANAGLVLPPDLDRLSLRQVGQVRFQRAREVFL